MAPRKSTPYPKSNSECVKLLKELGFKKQFGIGNSKHPEKYMHPSRRNKDLNDKPFILITHEYFDANGQRLMKRLQNWDFSQDEIRAALKRVR